MACRRRLVSMCYAILLVVLTGTSRLSAQECVDTGVSDELFKMFVNRHFASLISPQSGSILGNFVGIDIKDAEATIAAAAIGNGAVFGAKVTGGAADGILPIINGKEINPKFAANLQMNLLDLNGLTYSYDQRSCVAYFEKVRAIRREYELKKLEIEQNFPATLRNLQLAALDTKLQGLQAAHDAATGLRKDSLAVEVLKTRRTQDLLKSEVLPDQAALLFDLENWRIAEEEKVQSTLDGMGFSLGWFTVGYEIRNVTFRLFDPALPQDSQVNKTSNASHEIYLRYSRYRLSPARYETYLWALTAAVTYDHNLATLKKHDLTDRRVFGTAPQERVAETKYSAYQGDYRDDLVGLRFGGDYYRFLFVDNQAAAHLYPSVDLRESVAPTYNLGFGFLITARNTAKEGILNAELYLELNDLTNVADSDDDLWERKGIGLRLTFPINFRPGI